LLPIFYAQPWHAAKLRVGAYNGEAMRSGDSRDLEVIRANDTPLDLQLVPDVGVMPSRRIVKRKGRERCE
jgi:hypothetical protein